MKHAAVTILVLATGTAGMFGMLNTRGGLADPPHKPADLVTSSLPAKTVRLGMPQPQALPAQAFSAGAEATFTTGIAALSRRDGAATLAELDRLDRASVEWQALAWAIAVSGQSWVPSDFIADARSALETWPAGTDMEGNFERALYRENHSPASVLARLDPAHIQTPEGMALLVQAHLDSNDRKTATDLVRRYWRTATMDSAAEDMILKAFGGFLAPADHKARLVHLLFNDRAAQARRMAELAGDKTLVEAFGAITSKAKGRDKLLSAARAKWGNDPAILYLSIRNLRIADRYEEAASRFSAMPTGPALVNPGKWWAEMRIISRGLMEKGAAKAAYDLVAGHVAASPADISEAEFHAGWYALRGLRDSSAADAHFRALLAASPRAHDQARGNYWLGRVAAAGGPGDASAYFRAAARYPATFYGQLAAARLKLPPAQASPFAIDPASRIGFALRPPVRALALFEAAGEDGRARRLYLALARDLDRPADLQLLAEMALAKHGPALSLAIGKAALNQGHDPGLAAFPLGAIPETADISGAGRALAYAIARQESAFNPQAVSPADARGLLQLLPKTAKRVASRYQIAWAEEKLTSDPAYNATLGSHYLGEQIDKFRGSLVLTFAAYNAGPARIPQWIGRYGDPRRMKVDDVVDWVENIPFQETRDYVQKVMENYQIYKSLLKQPADIEADLTAGKG
jgi:soluble lytic murein transglycosylase